MADDTQIIVEETDRFWRARQSRTLTETASGVRRSRRPQVTYQSVPARRSWMPSMRLGGRQIGWCPPVLTSLSVSSGPAA